jgi:hypothetical protein
MLNVASDTGVFDSSATDGQSVSAVTWTNAKPIDVSACIGALSESVRLGHVFIGHSGFKTVKRNVMLLLIEFLFEGAPVLPDSKDGAPSHYYMSDVNSIISKICPPQAFPTHYDFGHAMNDHKKGIKNLLPGENRIRKSPMPCTKPITMPGHLVVPVCVT